MQHKINDEVTIPDYWKKKCVLIILDFNLQKDIYSSNSGKIALQRNEKKGDKCWFF